MQKKMACIDKVNFYEYCQLPGIICDRLYHIIPNKQKDCILETDFINTMLTIFLSDVKSKMKFTF